MLGGCGSPAARARCTAYLTRLRASAAPPIATTHPPSHNRPADYSTVGGVLHILFNPGPLELIVSNTGRLLDAQTRIEADPADKVIARLLKRGALVDLGPVPEVETPEE